jgi:hypothetical protein
MVPVDALIRYSMSDGEKGPPCGPENAMLADGVTVKDGGDCSADLCAAPSCVNNSVDAMVISTIDANWPEVLIVNLILHDDFQSAAPGPP